MTVLHSAAGPYPHPLKDFTSTMARNTPGNEVGRLASQGGLYHVHRFIDFASSTPEQLGQLAAACSQATFGRGNQDVYDESYRKALKMDATNFAVQFDPTLSGLTETIEQNLLRENSGEVSIKPEIYKLNLYGSIFCPLRRPIF